VLYLVVLVATGEISRADLGKLGGVVRGRK
jgi:hypothetical protein